MFFIKYVELINDKLHNFNEVMQFFYSLIAPYCKSISSFKICRILFKLQINSKDQVLEGELLKPQQPTIVQSVTPKRKWWKFWGKKKARWV